MIHAKEELSFVLETTIALDYKGKSYHRAINRELLEQLITPTVGANSGALPGLLGRCQTHPGGD